MYKVYCHIETNNVEQVYDLKVNPSLAEMLKEDLFGNTMYCIETEEPVSFDQRYNKETNTFEINPNYIEPNTEIMPTKIDTVEEKLKEKDEEILQLKMAIAEMSKEKDKEILKLKLVLAELIEGGI